MTASVFEVSPAIHPSIVKHLADKYGKQKGILIYPMFDDEILVATDNTSDYSRIKEELFILVSYESKGESWSIGTKELK